MHSLIIVSAQFQSHRLHQPRQYNCNPRLHPNEGTQSGTSGLDVYNLARMIVHL
ncbi:hypothetical protein CANARDRAFT_27959 [[Candida] arabinofermentans NRRL YB-2248]|uniref:Uncharacterized protein n=1 Tax=[Candida] arabinofermentans NRRL YB-2248 TaxID=983967 RepID=A0A1E4T2A8_9ASCO|nr:hypothetical protein CANARDRAFT_27959 [[Candida] arabinofermentans NRRL YB-2248]